MKATTAFVNDVMQPMRQSKSPGMKRLCGIDGCKYGWFALFCAENFSNIEWQLARNWTDLDLRDAIVAVDMPIGLADSGPRHCDAQARGAFGSKSSSVFSIPSRSAFAFDEWSVANQWSKDSDGKGITLQAWNIRKKVLELDNAITRPLQSSIFEAHPEIAFARLAAGRHLPPKRKVAGRTDRLALLEEHGVRGISDILGRLNRAQAKPDDVLDAAVLLLTAHRIQRGEAIRFPAQPNFNSRGLDMAIWV